MHKTDEETIKNFQRYSTDSRVKRQQTCYYPSWRRSLDIYKAWNGSNITIAEVAKRFKVDYRTAKRSVDRIGGIVFCSGLNWHSVSKIEAICVMVSKIVPSKHVFKLTRIIVSRFPTIEDFFACDILKNWHDISGIGPKYAAYMYNIQQIAKENRCLKDIHVRLSYQAYLNLKEYAEANKKTFSETIECAINNIL